MTEHHPDDHVDGGVEVGGVQRHVVRRHALGHDQLRRGEQRLRVRRQQRQQLGVRAVGGRDHRVQQPVVLRQLEHAARGRADRPGQVVGMPVEGGLDGREEPVELGEDHRLGQGGLGADLVVDRLPADPDPLGQPRHRHLRPAAGRWSAPRPRRRSAAAGEWRHAAVMGVRSREATPSAAQPSRLSASTGHEAVAAASSRGAPRPGSRRGRASRRRHRARRTRGPSPRTCRGPHRGRGRPRSASGTDPLDGLEVELVAHPAVGAAPGVGDVLSTRCRPRSPRARRRRRRRRCSRSPGHRAASTSSSPTRPKLPGLPRDPPDSFAAGRAYLARILSRLRGLRLARLRSPSKCASTRGSITRRHTAGHDGEHDHAGVPGRQHR